MKALAWTARDQVTIRRVWDWLFRQIPEIWRFDEHYSERDGYMLYFTPRGLSEPPIVDYCRFTIDALASEFGGQSLSEIVPEIFFFPGDAGSRAGSAEPSDWVALRRTGSIFRIAAEATHAWLRQHCEDYGLALLERRMEFILTRGLQVASVSSGWSLHVGDPPLGRCCALLADWREDPRALPICEKLLRGEWNVPVSTEDLERLSPDRLDWLVARAEIGTYGIFGVELIQGYWTALEVLARHGTLDYETFRMAGERSPLAIPGHVLRQPSGSHPTVVAFTKQHLWECVQTLGPDSYRHLEHYGSSINPRGGRFLIKACEHVESQGFETLTTAEFPLPPQPRKALLSFSAISALDEGETLEQLAETLERFSERTLACLLPHAGAGQDAVMMALGWSAALPLLREIRRIARWQFDTPYGSTRDGIQNSSDPTSGIVDRPALVRALDEAGDELARELIARMRTAGMLGHILMLVEACRGWNETRIRKGLRHHGQINLKALGLLPLESRAEAALERYRELKRAAVECSKYGAERQANTRAAVSVGIANLAQTAAFATPEEFEWAMELAISSGGARPGEEVPIEGYEVTLDLAEAGPQLRVARNGRGLKSVPAKLRKHPRYQELKDQMTDLRAQASRFRIALETAMVEGRQIPRSQIEQAVSIPTVREMLHGLVLSDGSGLAGMLSDASEALLDLEQKERPLPEALGIAHALHLRAAGTLRAWQTEIVRRRRVQPFKQAFRETYLVTEREAECKATRRYAGHQLNARVASKLLQSRGWQFETGDVVRAFRRFARARLRGWLDFDDAGHYLGETENARTADVAFTDEPTSELWKTPAVALGAVDPIVFSEVLRDTDLVVSVGRPGEEVLSSEGYAARAETAIAIVSSLGGPELRAEGRFLLVQGRRARYRIHLGSATVMVEPSGAVCILPASASESPDDLFLPFAEEDERMVEVVSKALLLANDEAITDPLILQQIEQQD